MTMANKITQERLDEIKDKCNAALCVAAPDQMLIKIRRLEKELEKMGKVAEEAVELAQTLVDELAQARAAAVQWVTYDGKEKNLPLKGKKVLLSLVLSDGTVYKDTLTTALINHHAFGAFWDGLDDLFDIRHPRIGDCWAYLPKPTEVK